MNGNDMRQQVLKKLKLYSYPTTIEKDCRNILRKR